MEGANYARADTERASTPVRSHGSDSTKKIFSRCVRGLPGPQQDMRSVDQFVKFKAGGTGQCHQLIIGVNPRGLAKRLRRFAEPIKFAAIEKIVNMPNPDGAGR